MAVESCYLNMNPYNNCYVYPPLSDTKYGVVVADSLKAESGITYGYQVNTRKRSRESTNPMMMSCTDGGDRCGFVTFLGEDLSVQMQQQELEMDQLIAQHTEKVRMEIEERRKHYSRRIIATIGKDITKRLKAKDDLLEKIRNLNWALQEKVQSLSTEVQIWCDMAHTNEATAHMLRNNLEQALAAQQLKCDDIAAIGDDAESCCGSNAREGEECGMHGGERMGEGMCRHCGEAEASVLLLPCRHLCLCTGCGSSVHTCPICNMPKNASFQVIM